jgi:hypothetical protein
VKKLDRKTRKPLLIHEQHQPKADVDQWYVHGKQRGRDLMQLEEVYIVEITRKLQIVRMHQHISAAMLQTTQCLKRELQRGTRQIKDRTAEKTKERWQGKWMHGQFPRN